MNEHDIETLLSGLQPREPSANLNRAVAKELETDRQWMSDTSERRRHSWLGAVCWSAAGAAATLAVMSVFSAGEPSAPTGPLVTVTPPSVLPVTTIREVVAAEPEGIQYNANSRLPEQRVRLKSLERQIWTDPRDGAQITLERPREDSVVLPVSFQ